jgi:hypothetical protein
MTFKYLAPTSQKANCDSITKTKLLMLFREIISFSVRIPSGTSHIFLLQNVQTGFRVYSSSYPICTLVLSREYSGRGVMLTTHLHLVPRLRVSRAIFLFLLYAFMALTGIVSPFFITETHTFKPECKAASNIRRLRLSCWVIEKTRCELCKDVYNTATNTEAFSGILNEKDQRYSMLYWSRGNEVRLTYC